MFRTLANALCSILIAASVRLPLNAEGIAEWPQFRGVDGLGNVSDAERQGARINLPLIWSETENVVWKAAIPGRGWSSPVIANDVAWLTTAEEIPATEEQLARMKEKAKLDPTVAQLKTVSLVKLSVVCIDLSNGRRIRQVPLFEVAEPQGVHQLNSFASPTPVLDKGRCYCHFGAFGTACVDASNGEVVWRQTLPIEHSVGPGSSPVLYDDLLIIPCDGTDRQFIAALDVVSGKIAWQTSRPPIRHANGDFRKSFSTPLLIKTGGMDQVVIPGAQWFIAYNPRTGKEIWRLDHGAGFSLVPRPVFDGDFLYMCTGFTGPELWAVPCDRTGDLNESDVAWRYKRQVPTMPSPVMVGKRLFLISDAGVATCLDATTGRQIWQKRMPGKYSASPLAAGDRLYFCSHEGVTTVIRSSDSYEVLATNSLAGSLMASPAVVGDDLLLRTDGALYRIAAPTSADAGETRR